MCCIFCPVGLSGFLNPCFVQLSGSSGFPCSWLSTCSMTSCHTFYSDMCTFLDLCVRHTANICWNNNLISTYLSSLVSHSTSSCTLQSSQTGPFSIFYTTLHFPTFMLWFTLLYTQPLVSPPPPTTVPWNSKYLLVSTSQPPLALKISPMSSL